MARVVSKATAKSMLGRAFPAAYDTQLGGIDTAIKCCLRQAAAGKT